MRGRRRLAAVGIAAASIVVGTATTVGYGLATGFDRAAREADLPDVVAHFDRERRPTLDARVRALPNLESRSYRREITGIRLRDAHGHFLRRGTVHIVLGGRRGYAITDGHDLSPRPGEVVIERGLAEEWSLRPGDPLRLEGFGDLRVAGVALSPDNVAFPLASTARVYVGEQEVRDAFDFREEIRPDIALLWLHDPARADITLAQARVTSFGIGSLSFITREGIRVLLSEAAGIVISLLVAFSLVALLAAGTMLASGAHADVQRRLGAIGVQRALGFTPVGDRRAPGAGGGARRAPGGRGGDRDRGAGGARAFRVAARGAQRAAARRGARAAAARRPGRRRRARHRRRDLARLAGRPPLARGDPARRRPRPAAPGAAARAGAG